MADQKILDKIAALFAKAQASTFSDEADAFNAKAVELMTKYSVDQSMLTGADKQEVTVKTVMVGKPITVQTLFAVAATVNDCVTVKHLAGQGRSARSTGEISIIGLPEDIKMALLLFGSLMMQSESALSRQRVPFGMHARTFNNDFRTGFNGRVYARLTEARKEASNGIPGSAVVLRSKLEAVKAAAPGLVGATRKSAAVARKVSADAYHAGVAAGSTARLGQTEVSGNRAAIGA